MLDVDAQPHVMDFGLAKRETDEATMTQEGDVMGTPAYMSPERARGAGHHVDAKTDTDSLGTVLYELLTGERPFQGNRRMIKLAEGKRGQEPFSSFSPRQVIYLRISNPHINGSIPSSGFVVARRMASRVVA